MCELIQAIKETIYYRDYTKEFYNYWLKDKVERWSATLLDNIEIEDDYEMYIIRKKEVLGSWVAHNGNL